MLKKRRSATLLGLGRAQVQARPGRGLWHTPKGLNLSTSPIILTPEKTQAWSIKNQSPKYKAQTQSIQARTIPIPSEISVCGHLGT
jgi:hypothetical protein